MDFQAIKTIIALFIASITLIAIINTAINVLIVLIIVALLAFIFDYPIVLEVLFTIVKALYNVTQYLIRPNIGAHFGRINVIYEPEPEVDCEPNLEPFECSICYTEVDVGVGVLLQNCLHNFCRECLCRHIELAEEPEVRCLFDPCDFTLQDREVRGIATPEVYKLYCRRSLTAAQTGSQERSFHCRTPDCPGWCFLGVADRPEVFVCGVCSASNCIRCQAIHRWMKCEDYRLSQDQQAQVSMRFLENLLARGEAMRCPGCSVIVQKTSGCDGMKCTMCRIELCWATKGPRWGPRGKGDTSGGCRCMVGGDRCSPQCTNCH